ncbi:hypothetical protein BY996DRAFT_6514524 [Phakopsora pachyrhizi]|nr:hypothetical protein BY996DRAFT_6514524 [Phakopsora pachyrhizi]
MRNDDEQDNDDDDDGRLAGDQSNQLERGEGITKGWIRGVMAGVDLWEWECERRIDELWLSEMAVGRGEDDVMIEDDGVGRLLIVCDPVTEKPSTGNLIRNGDLDHEFPTRSWNRWASHDSSDVREDSIYTGWNVTRPTLLSSRGLSKAWDDGTRVTQIGMLLKGLVKKRSVIKAEAMAVKIWQRGGYCAIDDGPGILWVG